MSREEVVRYEGGNKQCLLPFVFHDLVERKIERASNNMQHKSTYNRRVDSAITLPPLQCTVDLETQQIERSAGEGMGYEYELAIYLQKESVLPASLV